MSEPTDKLLDSNNSASWYLTIPTGTCLLIYNCYYLNVNICLKWLSNCMSGEVRDKIKDELINSKVNSTNNKFR